MNTTTDPATSSPGTSPDTNGRWVLRTQQREYHDPADPWGSNIDFFFAVADTLVYANATDSIPGGWGYHPGPFIGPGQRPDAYLSQLLVDHYTAGAIDTADLLHAGRVCARFDDLCRAAGRDY